MPFFHDDPLYQYVIAFLAGSTFLGIIAHAVTTFPTPKNVYGQWLLGLIKYIVGQRISAQNAFKGYQTEVTAVTREQKEALNNGSTLAFLPPGWVTPSKAQPEDEPK